MRFHYSLALVAIALAPLSAWANEVPPEQVASLSWAASTNPGVVGTVAQPYVVYDSSCAFPPNSFNHVYYINLGGAVGSVGAGDFPNTSWGGTGTADGSQAHPFNSLKAVFSGGLVHPVSGYAYPLLSTVSWDHLDVNVGYGVSKGVNGNRTDWDWNQGGTMPVGVNRINPGDEIILESGSYGDISLGGLSNFAINTTGGLIATPTGGTTSFVRIIADQTNNAVPVFSTLSALGTYGFVVDGVTVQSTLLDGSAANGDDVLQVKGTAASPNRDLIFANMTLQTYPNLAAAQADYIAHGNTGSITQAFILSAERSGNNNVGDVDTGVNSLCEALEYSTQNWVLTGYAVHDSSKILQYHNITHLFGQDGVDLDRGSNVTFEGNQFYDPMLLNGNHPDTFQYGVLTTETGPYTNIVIDSNMSIERTDATNPYPNNITCFQHTNSVPIYGIRVTNNLCATSNCPGIAAGYTSYSTFANNVTIGNGVLPGATCPSPQSGESEGTSESYPVFSGYISGTTLTITSGPTGGTPLKGMTFTGPGVSAPSYFVSGSGTSWTIFPSQTVGSVGSPVSMKAFDMVGNTWANNVSSRFYQICGNGTVWENNTQIPQRSAGTSTPNTLSYCNGTSIVSATTNGTYNGVTINTTNSPSFAFINNDPPSTGLLSIPPTYLGPTVSGVLYGTGVAGTGIPTVNILGQARSNPPNQGAY